MSDRVDESKAIGGQAVVEGVMMRAPGSWAVAVRNPAGEIVVRRHSLARLSERFRLARIPFVRGVFVLGESLSLGMKALAWSAQQSAEEDEEPLSRGQIAWSMALALVLFGALFIVAPAAAARVFSGESSLWFNVLEGLLRLVLFVAYIWVIGRSREIGRVFEYHGAEHMSIHAFESGQPLSFESVRRFPPEHPRCGTSFLLIVIIGSILLFSLFGRPGWLFLVSSRVLGIPVIAGAAYELLRFSGTRKADRLSRFLAAPGLWLQKLTTRQPDESQIEVAVASLMTALDGGSFDEVVNLGGVSEAALAARRRGLAEA